MKKGNGRLFYSDVNGPVFDTNGAKHARLVDNTGLAMPRDDFEGKSCVGRVYPSVRAGEPARSLRKKDYADMTRDLFEDPDCFAAYVKPTPGAVQSLQYLWNRGHRITFVSNMREDKRRLFEPLLEKHGIRYHELIFTGGGPKTPYYEGADTVVDDQRQHLSPIVKAVRHAILLLAPQGAAGHTVAKAPPDVERRIRVAERWSEVLGYA
jgi:hypothetical protein